MLLGPAREAEMVDGWKRKYNTDMFTSSQNQVNAFRALKAKRILGITSGSGGPEMNKVYAKYFEDNGIGVVAMEGMGVEFKSIPDVPPATIASFIKKAFAEHAGADAVYILGSALEALPLIAPLERELGVPVVQAIAARIWEIQRRSMCTADQGLWPPARNAPSVGRAASERALDPNCHRFTPLRRKFDVARNRLIELQHRSMPNLV